MSIPIANTRYYSKTQRIAAGLAFSDRDVFQVPFFISGQLMNARAAAFRVPGRGMWLQGYSITLQQQNSPGAAFSVNLLNGAGLPAVVNVAPDPTLVTVASLQTISSVQFSPFIGLPSGSYWQANIVVPTASVGLTGSGMTLTYIFSYANSPVTNSQATYALSGEGIGYMQVGASDFIVSTP